MGNKGLFTNVSRALFPWVLSIVFWQLVSLIVCFLEIYESKLEMAPKFQGLKIRLKKISAAFSNLVVFILSLAGYSPSFLCFI